MRIAAFERNGAPALGLVVGEAIVPVGEMINRIDAQVAYISTVMTLMPGDILATGTPAGVGAGHDPPRWVKAGQTVRIEIEKLGAIENPVIAEPLAETTRMG